jgi:Flp pilus assembly pilin Flp
MAHWVHDFWLEEEGQDMAEYALLIFFITTMLVALAMSGTASVNGILGKGSSELVCASSAATGN